MGHYRLPTAAFQDVLERRIFFINFHAKELVRMFPFTEECFGLSDSLAFELDVFAFHQNGISS